MRCGELLALLSMLLRRLRLLLAAFLEELLAAALTLVAANHRKGAGALFGALLACIGTMI